MPDKIGALARGPLWIIACYRNNRAEVLTVDPDGDGGYLPVFSFEEEADTFLYLSEDDQEGRRWRCRQTTAGELASVLLEPCTKVRQVTLDPLPLSLGRAMLPYISVARERFVEDLMGSRGELAEEPHESYRRDEEKSVLITAGYEQLPDDLWVKDGVLFGRQAAFQNALRCQDEGGEADG